MPGSLSTKIALGSLKDFGCSLTLTCSWPQWQTHMFTSFWDQPGYENPICPETKVISVKPSWVSYDLLVLKTQYEVGETNWNQGTPPKKCASHGAPRASPRRLSLKLTAADHAMGWTKITRRQSLLGYNGIQWCIYIHTVYVRLNHQFILSFPFPCLHQRLRREITFNKQFSVRLMTSEPNKPNSMRIPMLAIQKTLRTPRKKKGCLVTKAFQTVNPQMAHHKGTTFYG